MPKRRPETGPDVHQASQPLCNFCGHVMVTPARCDDCGTSYPADAKRSHATDLGRFMREMGDPRGPKLLIDQRSL